jgi:hypothetical protein
MEPFMEPEYTAGWGFLLQRICYAVPRMNTLRIGLLTLLALVLTSCKDEGKQEIMDVFDSYVAALDKNDGAAAVALMDDKFFDDFQFILQAARSASREKVFRMRPSERVRIAGLRNRLTTEELRKVDAREAVKLYIERDVDPGFDFQVELGRITFKLPRAYGQLLFFGFETKSRVEFVKANNVWKLDPSWHDEQLDRVIVKQASSSGMREDTIILNRESSNSGKQVTDAIWDPPR